MEDREQRIREIAYRIWEEEGCPSDQAHRHWQLAELIVMKEDTELPRLTPHATGEPKAA